MSPRELTIRPVTLDDVDEVVSLWLRGGVDHNPDTDRDEIVTKLDYDGDLFLVAHKDGVLVASIMGTYDGHRGRIKRCVVDPAARGSGVGRIIVADLEQRFRDRGITELRLEVWDDNTAGQAFWRSLDWTHLDTVMYYTKSL